MEIQNQYGLALFSCRFLNNLCFKCSYCGSITYEDFTNNGLNVSDDYEFPITLEKVETIIYDDLGNPVKDDNGKVKTRSITDGIQIKGKIINNGTNNTTNANAKFVIEDIDSGVYKVTETQPNDFFELVDMQAINKLEGMDISKREDGNYYLTVNRIDVTEYKMFAVKVTNKIESDKNISIKFIKEIEGTNESFEKSKLKKDDDYNFSIRLTNTETGDIINGLLNSKKGFTITNIPAGIYVIKESDDIWFDFVSIALSEQIKGIDFNKVDGDYFLTIDETVDADVTIGIKITNKPKEERYYNIKYDAMNIFGL